MPKKNFFSAVPFIATMVIAGCESNPPDSENFCIEPDTIPLQIACEIRTLALLDKETRILEFEDGTQVKPQGINVACVFSDEVENPLEIAINGLNASPKDFLTSLYYSETYYVCSGRNGTISHICIELCTPVICASAGNFGPQMSEPVDAYSTIDFSTFYDTVRDRCQNGEEPQAIVQFILDQ